MSGASSDKKGGEPTDPGQAPRGTAKEAPRGTAGEAPPGTAEEPLVELEELTQEEPAPPLPIPADASVAAEVWRLGYQDNSIPCLLLDRSLRIIQANPAFCALFDCGERVNGVYFTQFYSSSFDARKSAELFRAVRSAD